MVGYKNYGEITFYYDSDRLFDEIGLLSAYMVKNLPAENRLDEFSISDDEKDVYDVCVKQALPNIYETLVKLSSGIQNAFNPKAEEPGCECRHAGTYIELTIRDNSAYNENVLGLVDTTIEDCLKYGILTEFYSININPDLLKLAKSKFSDCLLLLNQRLFQLKKKAVSAHI